VIQGRNSVRREMEKHSLNEGKGSRRIRQDSGIDGWDGIQYLNSAGGEARQVNPCVRDPFRRYLTNSREEKEERFQDVEQ